ncbi:E3 ubiquitin-protein ligase DIS1 [Anthophora quadrimaculata]
MSVISTSELLTEAAGVRIYRMENCTSTDSTFTGKICVLLENVKKTKALGKSCGFNLTKSKWDPYPWISYIEIGSLADIAGLKAGDCLISIGDHDLIGLKIKDIAALIHRYQECNLKLFIWRCIDEEKEQKNTGIAVKGPLSEVANKLANAVSGVVQTLECPVCLESSSPPVSQCVHGHIICVGCRPRTLRCPICRVRLGQGRCLLADKLHKVFCDVFSINDNSCNSGECQTRNLRDRLFGRNKRNEVTRKSNSTNLKTRRLLLNKLFRGGSEKAASADNLTVVTDESLNVNDTLTSNLNHDEQFNLYDRTKSASTGELSKETITNVKGQIAIPSNNSSMSNVSSTSVWGDSTDSVFYNQITCPLSKHGSCNENVTIDTVLRHLNEIHGVPQVHFYSLYAKLPVPLPFGSEAVYVLHSGEELFFLQCEDETIWISTTGGNITWEWSLYGQGQNGSEIKIRKSVASLVKPMVLSSQHIAPLPSALLLHTLNIQLIKYRSHNELKI